MDGLAGKKRKRRNKKNQWEVVPGTVCRKSNADQGWPGPD
jgi:hypothetical protein